MSLRISRHFGSRGPSETEEPTKKYIFVFEGEKTEKQYFEGLFNRRLELEISDIIEISTFERIDPSLSNQLKIVQALHEQLNEVVNLKDSIEITIHMLKNVFIELNITNVEHLLSRARKIIADGDQGALKEFVDAVLEKEIQNGSVAQLLEKLTTLKDFMGYEKGFDTVCIIIDRDKQSFKKDQFEAVLEICAESNYSLGVSNPCFEFWLLLHLTDCTEYAAADIQENKRVSNKKRYLEQLLSDQLGKAYKKNRLVFDDYQNGIRNGIARAKSYCQDNTLLENEIGSSVGIVVEELLNN